MPRLEDQYKSTIHVLVQRILKLEEWRRAVTGNSPLFDIANEHTPATLNSDQNNYDPGYYDVLRINANRDISITGITKGKKGRFLEFVNVGTGRITFQDENAGSLAANRIATPYDEPVTLLNNARARFYYDSTNARWTLSDAPNIQGLFGKSALIASNTIAITNVPNATETVLTPNEVLSDEWGYWDSVNFRFQLPSNENGLYLVGFAGSWAVHVTGGTLRQIRFMRNGANNFASLGVPSISNIATNICLTAVIRLLSGEFVEIHGRQDSGGNLDINRLQGGTPNAIFVKLE